MTKFGKYGQPGPFHPPQFRYDPQKFTNESYLYKLSGTRDEPESKLGMRDTVYAEPDRPETCYRTELADRPNSLAETVERDMGNCVPCRQDTAPAYGPPGGPSNFRTYPVRARFQNRMKWNEDFGSPFVNPGGGTAGIPGDPTPGSAPLGRGVRPVAGGGGPGGGPLVTDPQVAARSQQDVVYHPRDPPPPKHDPVLLGCNITSNGEDQYAHRFTYLNRFFNEEDGEILVGPPKGMEDKQYGQYSDELFMTEESNSENKLSTGVMVNPYTGEMFETFENAMPPPNTNKFIPQERFDIVNPKLVWAQGGIDPHAPLPKKKEICKKMPGVDHGPNVWGDQLYADERRKRLREIANRDVWMNRNGDYSTPRGFAKEKPAGFTGLVPYYRPLPYLPPTQTLDKKGYVPITGQTFPNATSVKGQVFTRKPDLTNCMYQFGAGPPNDVETEYVVQDLEPKHTWRGFADSDYRGVTNTVVNQTGGGEYVVLDTDPRDTLKIQMEDEFPVPVTDTIVNQTGGGEYVVQDTEPRNTLKIQMESEFPNQIADTIVAQTGGAEYVVLDTEPRNTLKEQMETQFPSQIANTIVAQTGGAEYVVLDTEPRNTLKEQMECNFPSQIANTIVAQTGGAEYVVQDTTVRDTLKEQMESQFPVQIANTIVAQTGGAEYVVQDTEVRNTLKEQMETQFPAQIANTIVAQTGGAEYVVQDTEVRSTLKEQMESEFPQSGVDTINQMTGGGEYVVIDRDPRWTWKIEMEGEFPQTAVNDGYLDGDGAYSGSWIPFQGPLEETRRQFYEELPNVGRQAHSAFFGGQAEAGSFVGAGTVTSKQHRGTFPTNYVNLSKVQADAKDTSIRWIGEHTRDTRRELVPYTPQAELSTYQATMPRMFGTVAFPCNIDTRGETDDEFNSMSHGFLYPVQQAVQG